MLNWQDCPRKSQESPEEPANPATFSPFPAETEPMVPRKRHTPSGPGSGNTEEAGS